MDATQSYQIEIIQGTDIIKQIQYLNAQGSPVPLTGFTAEMVFLQNYGNTNQVIFLSTTNGLILINGPAGVITLTIPHSITSTLAVGMTLVYNLFLTSTSGIVTPLLGGTAIVRGSTIL